MQNIYKRHRFPPSVIQHAVWLYYRFNLSVRDVEDLLAERNISVSYEAIRLWINKFGPEFTKRLRRRHSGFGDTYFLDEVFVKIGGIQHYLWRAVDQAGTAVSGKPCRCLQPVQSSPTFSVSEVFQAISA